MNTHTLVSLLLYGNDHLNDRSSMLMVQCVFGNPNTWQSNALCFSTNFSPFRKFSLLFSLSLYRSTENALPVVHTSAQHRTNTHSYALNATAHRSHASTECECIAYQTNRQTGLFELSTNAEKRSLVTVASAAIQPQHSVYSSSNLFFIQHDSSLHIYSIIINNNNNTATTNTMTWFDLC